MKRAPKEKHFIQISFFMEGNITVGERNGNPFLYSCLENPMDRGAWWAAVQGDRTESDVTDAT